VALWLARERRCRCLFATHHHGLCREGQLRPLVQLAHMESAVEPGGRGLLPSFRLASGARAGPAGQHRSNHHILFLF
jgi:DNA mismatch repair ATPase MutS